MAQECESPLPVPSVLEEPVLGLVQGDVGLLYLADHPGHRVVSDCLAEAD